MKQVDKIQNMVKYLTSLGVNIKKTKSRLDIMNTLPASATVTHKLKVTCHFYSKVRVRL